MSLDSAGLSVKRIVRSIRGHDRGRSRGATTTSSARVGSRDRHNLRVPTVGLQLQLVTPGFPPGADARPVDSGAFGAASSYSSILSDRDRPSVSIPVSHKNPRRRGMEAFDTANGSSRGTGTWGHATVAAVSRLCGGRPAGADLRSPTADADRLRYQSAFGGRSTGRPSRTETSRGKTTLDRPAWAASPRPRIAPRRKPEVPRQGSYCCK